MSFEREIVVGPINPEMMESMRKLAEKLMRATDSREEAAGKLVTVVIKTISDILPQLSETDLLKIATPISESLILMSAATTISDSNTFETILELAATSDENVTKDEIVAKVESIRIKRGRKYQPEHKETIQ